MGELLPNEQGVSVCESHAKHGIASGAVVPPGFSFCVVCENARLRHAIHQACSDMGCYCADDDPLPDNLKCPMCKLEKALHG